MEHPEVLQGIFERAESNSLKVLPFRNKPHRYNSSVDSLSSRMPRMQRFVVLIGLNPRP